MEQKSLINEYRSVCVGDKPKQLTSLEEFIWNGTYTISLLWNDKSLRLPFEFEGEEVIHLAVKDQARDADNQNDRLVVQTLTRVNALSGHVLTYTRTRRYKNGEHKWGEWVGSDSGVGGTIAIDSGINPESYNTVQNRAIAQALEDAVARGRELAKRDLYIAAGALYNDTDEVIKRTAFWGEEVDHLPKHYYLNGLGDIGEDEMMKIYQHKDDMTMFLVGKNQNRFFQYNAFKGYRTIFGFRGGTRYVDGLSLSATVPFGNTNDLEIIKWLEKDSLSFDSGKCLEADGFFHNITNVKVIDVYTPSKKTTFMGAKALNEVRLHQLKYNVDLQYSSNISKESILYMINNALPISAISITLHPAAYVKFEQDTEIIVALETAPLISLVSA